MQKIIFLDIDGVIATPKYVKNGAWALNPEKQELLGTILEKTGAEIVLSSSWRLHDLDATKEYMEAEGFLFTDKLIGITIRAYQWIQRGSGIHLSIPRGVEIKQWIDTHIHSDNGKNWSRKQIGADYNYVILDDDSDMLLQHKDHFVRTESLEGLTGADCEMAVKILNTTV